MSVNGVLIIDGHAHVGSTKFVPGDFIRGIAENICASSNAKKTNSSAVSQVSRLLNSQHQDHSAEELVSQMDAAGVDRCVLLIPDFTHVMSCSMSIEDMALRHADIRSRHPGRFHVFQGVDPRSGRRGVELFERTLSEFKFEGLKLYPPCGYSPSDRSLFPYYEICAAHRAPVLLHTGPTSPTLTFEFSSPLLIDEAARLFPAVNFILAHGGVSNVHEAASMCAYRPNVYMDIAGFLSVLHPRGWKEHLKELFSMSINHKIIFGTDWPFGRMAGGLTNVVEQMFGKVGPLAGLHRADVEKIMGANIKRLLPIADCVTSEVSL